MSPNKDQQQEYGYIVLADYPNSPYEIGERIELSETGTTGHMTTTFVYDDFDATEKLQENYVTIDKFDKYPHLFKNLSTPPITEVKEQEKKLAKGCEVFMKGSSGLVGYGNIQCVSSVCEPLDEMGLYGSNQHYKIWDIDRIVSYPHIHEQGIGAPEDELLKRFAKQLEAFLDYGNLESKRLATTTLLTEYNNHLNKSNGKQ